MGMMPSVISAMMSPSLTVLGWDGAGNRSGEDLLRAGARVIPEGMHERVIGAQPLIIADEAFAVKIAWLIDCRIPTLGGHAQVGSQRLQVAVKLRQIGIDQ